jgi:hypothetical protein
MSRLTKTSTDVSASSSRPARRSLSNNTDIWRLAYVYPRFVLLSPLFDIERWQQATLATPR